MVAVFGAQAPAEDFAQPPQWTEEVEGVFFKDARKELKGEPPTQADTDGPEKLGATGKPSEQAVWRDLISPSALESAVKASVNRIGQVLHKPTRSAAIRENVFGRELTLLGTVFEVISTYPAQVRWQSTAHRMSQMCLRAAESSAEIAQGSNAGPLQDTYSALEEALGGQTTVIDDPAAEPLVAEFVPLMQAMKFISEEGISPAIDKRTQFRRNALSVGEKAQLLAMLSQVIRGEEYGYADDESYQRHADKLRDAAKQLNEAATAEEFEKAVQAAAAIQKSCADCHADFRG